MTSSEPTKKKMYLTLWETQLINWEKSVKNKRSRRTRIWLWKSSNRYHSTTRKTWHIITTKLMISLNVQSSWASKKKNFKEKQRTLPLYLPSVFPYIFDYLCTISYIHIPKLMLQKWLSPDFSLKVLSLTFLSKPAKPMITPNTPKARNLHRISTLQVSHKDVLSYILQWWWCLHCCYLTSCVTDMKMN